MTILDAVEAALASENEPRSAAEILRKISERKLYDFKARDPIGVLRAAIRKHRRAGGARIREVAPDRYSTSQNR